MKIKMIIFAFCCAVVSGCGYYRSITGTVVDAETMQPIEGAVVMVEWTKQEGFPLSHTKSFKVVEAVSDKNGKVFIEGLSNSSVDPPDVAVYKPGYVAWGSRAIFPSFDKRKDFKWGDYTFKLERFKPNYSYVEHGMSFDSAVSSSLNNGAKRFIIDTLDSAEKERRIEERNHNDAVSC